MKKFVLCLTLFIILGAVYCGAWLWMKKAGEAEIDTLFAHAAQNNITFLGPKPRIEGFPFIPRVTYTEGIHIRNWQASFSTMTLSGFPVPGLPITLEFPGGVIAWIDGDREPVALDHLSITARIPWPLPRSAEESDISTWQAAGGKLHITDSFVRYDGMEMSASGTLSLDEALQPEAVFTSRTKGYAAFIRKMTDAERIKPFAGVALLAALNNFAQPDPDAKDGEMIAELPVTIRDRGVYVGPLLIQELPAIVWDRNNPPALHQ